MSGRIESYIHSDSLTASKGGCLVRVTCQTDFAARTGEFISFCRQAARHAFAAGADSWDETGRIFPDAEAARIALEASIKEKVTIGPIYILGLND